MKLYGNDGPDIRVTARSPGDAFKTLGDTLAARRRSSTSRCCAPERAPPAPATTPCGCSATGPRSPRRRSASDDFSTTFDSTQAGRYSIEVTRLAPGGDRIEVYSSPVWFEVGPAFELGKLKRNKKNGTAKLEVTGLRVPGELEVTGKGLKTKRKTAGPGSAKLKIKPKGKTGEEAEARRARRRSRSRSASRPQGGEPAQLSEKLKLKRKPSTKHGHR